MNELRRQLTKPNQPAEVERLAVSIDNQQAAVDDLEKWYRQLISAI